MAFVSVEGLIFLVFAYKSGTESGAQLAFGHGSDEAVEVHLSVNTPDDAVAVIPEITLFAGKGFDGDAVEGAQRYIKATQRVVNTQIAVFIGTENHAAAELLVEVTCRNTDDVALVTDKVVGNAFALVHVVETQQGVVIGLKTQTGTEISVCVKNVGTSVHQQFFLYVPSSDYTVGT